MKLRKEFKGDFEEFLEENEVALTDFREWYANVYEGVPVGVIRRQINKMNRIAEDERVGPRSRMLATYTGAYWSAKLFDDNEEKAFIASIILGEFINRNGFKLYGIKDTNPDIKNAPGTKLELSAISNLKKAFSNITSNLQQEGFLPKEDGPNNDAITDTSTDESDIQSGEEGS